ncbi:hypothetical protein Godav_017523 [Gossypium davidsonii]|uniref:OTU domain-containing protein n=1 Tax=Gossypium davidsonii TaxID=34287 RepID=A0A7J8QTS9_GOSDV|nr:hypothetical protein [Gossypium davidsonii]
MRLVRAMQRLFRDEVNVLGWKKSFSQGIGVTVPKARTRDKPMTMTRILVQRGSTGSSSLNLSRSSSLPGPSAFSTHQVPSAAKDGEVNEEVSELVASDEHLECSRSSENKGVKDDPLVENLRNDRNGTSSDAIAEAEKDSTVVGFTSYCKRKRRDKVYGSNVEIQALSEMYNRPIHIYSYSIEVRTMLYCFEIYHFVTLNLNVMLINISCHLLIKLHTNRQSWRRGGSTLIWSLLRRKSSEWAEYLGNDKFKMHVERASTAEPSSSGARSESSKVEGSKEQVLSSWMELVLSMGFSYLQAIEAYSILGDDVESMVLSPRNRE